MALKFNFENLGCENKKALLVWVRELEMRGGC